MKKNIIESNQVHKNVKLTRVKTVNNILKIWKLAGETDKYDWYAEALNYAFSLTSLSGCIPDRSMNINQACGIIAALSPLKTWEQNKTEAMRMVLTGECGHMKAFKKKAMDIMQSSGDELDILKVLNGNKIQSFYLNIRYPDKAINLTIDRHALSVCLSHWIDESEYSGMTKKQYDFFSSCYRHAAAKVGVNPLIMQSATWLVWRRIKKTWTK